MAKHFNLTRTNVALWTVQGMLAALFLFAGVMKLVTPAEMLADMMPLPVAFVKFIGMCETLGALGLILPGLFRMQRGLTPAAATGLVMIMIGATVTTVILIDAPSAVFPFVVGVLCALVAYGRRRQLIGRSAVAPRLALQPAS